MYKLPSSCSAHSIQRTKPVEEWKRTRASHPKIQPKGYYILSIPKSVYENTLRSLLQNNGYHGLRLNEISSSNKISYIHQSKDNSRSVSKTLYRLSCTVKNDVITEGLCVSILSKTSLASSEFLSHVLPESYQLRDFRYTGGVWILKIDRKYSCSGKDNYIIHDKDSFEKAKREVAIVSKENSQTNYLRGVVVNRYINNPLLFNGKKTHFRAYILISTTGEHSISDFSVMYTGSSQYVQSDYNNKKIHDSHVSSTSSVEIFDNKRDSLISDAIQHVCSSLVREISKYSVLSFTESKNGYKIIAPDIMITEDYKPYLLEVNTEPGFGLSKLPGFEEYYRRLATWEYENGIKPLLQ